MKSKHVDFEMCTQENKASEIELQSANPTCVHTFYTDPFCFPLFWHLTQEWRLHTEKTQDAQVGPNLQYGSKYTGTQDTQDTQDTQVRP